jgi:hypothetical protein
MPRKVKTAARKAGSKVARTARKLTTKPNPRKRVAKAKKAPVARAKKKAPEPQAAKPKRNPTAARPLQRTSDVPLDLLSDAYVPKQTNMKTSFRSDGADQQSDQEISPGEVDRFRDEDHFTNKSGDNRIGTHGRTGVPDQAPAPPPR